MQHTTGFGIRMTSEKCPDAVFLTCLQSIVGVMLEAFLVGMIFTKIARPKKRAETLIFSKNAVVCQRDGCLTLQVRVGDLRKSRIVEAHVRAIVVKRRVNIEVGGYHFRQKQKRSRMITQVTPEGEELILDQTEIDIGTQEGEDRVLMLWPATLIHVISPDSPFYAMSADDLAKANFELIVVLEGIVETTGLSVQARASYLSNEILWGHRQVITF